MVSIPGGTFVQGSPAGELGSWEDERPQHEVTLAAFNMSKYPITEKRYRDVMDLSLLGPETADFPVQPVTWFDALRFCNKLSERAGMQPAYTIEGSRVDWNRNANGYRLPTESEWEYATRAGSTTMYYFGDDPARLPEYGWFADDGDLDVDGNQRKPVGRRPANPWGLHDLCGNVAEWCWDLYVPYDQHHQYGVSKTDRVVRGRIDSYIGRARALRSAARFHADPKKAEVHFGIGFRCVLPVHVPENVQR
jgi:formylglycine-generating enzyme required for sulfatase activity